jgi:hypothetical protein
MYKKNKPFNFLTMLNLKNNPFNIIYWIIVIVVIKFLIGLYGMNVS